MLPPFVLAVLVLMVLSSLEACSKKAESPPPLPSTQSGESLSSEAPPTAPTADCMPGFEWKEGRCADLDECSFVADVCGTPLAQCTNKEGGYECTCPRGYAGGGPLGIACTPRVVAGVSASCALPESGGVTCWGAKEGGVWSSEYPEEVSAKPTPIEFADDAVALALGSEHACILRKNATVGCWGSNKYGQLGNGVDVRRTLPHLVPGLTDVVRVANGPNVSCAVLRHGGLRCWGGNYSGQLARAGDQNAPTPVTIDVGRVVAVVPGVGHTCALRHDGTISCWGSNEAGQLGTGTQEPTDYLRLPTEVAGLKNVRALAENTALLADGGVVFWGEDQTHMKMTLDEITGVVLYGPTRIPELREAVAVAGTRFKTCALLKQGSVWCRGVGPLGDGKDRSSRTPVRVARVVHALALSPRGDCALDAEKGVLCWGSNRYKRLGTAKGNQALSATAVAGVRVLVQQ